MTDTWQKSLKDIISAWRKNLFWYLHCPFFFMLILFSSSTKFLSFYRCLVVISIYYSPFKRESKTIFFGRLYDLTMCMQNIFVPFINAHNRIVKLLDMNSYKSNSKKGVFLYSCAFSIEKGKIKFLPTDSNLLQS